MCLQEIRPHDAVVNNCGAIETSGDHQPNEENALKQKNLENLLCENIHYLSYFLELTFANQ